jgi:zinc transport system permease protein
VDAEPTFEQFWAAWDLFRDPILCALIAGAALGFLGVYVVLRRMVFVSAAVTQSAGLGVALAFYAEIHLGMHVDPIIGASALALFATFLLLLDPQGFHLTREAVLGLVFATTGAAAVMVGDRISQEAHDIQSILLGTAVVVRPLDLQVLAVASVVAAVVHLWWFRGLTFASFDPVTARVQGLPVAVLHGAVLISIGVLVGISARALGALPVFGMSVLPAVAALVSGLGLRGAFAAATFLGAAAGAIGYLVAFLYQFPVGASQTVVAASFVLLAWIARAAARAFAGRGPTIAAPASIRPDAVPRHPSSHPAA